MMADLPHRPGAALASEVVDLLRRYPGLGHQEGERLLEAFKELPIFERALMTSDETLRAALDAFRRDHRRELQPPFWQPVLLLGMPVSMLIAVIWGLWMTAVGG
jgi:hypothetical protein